MGCAGWELVVCISGLGSESFCLLQVGEEDDHSNRINGGRYLRAVRVAEALQRLVLHQRATGERGNLCGGIDEELNIGSPSEEKLTDM